jgi:hypothetical protein
MKWDAMVVHMRWNNAIFFYYSPVGFTWLRHIFPNFVDKESNIKTRDGSVLESTQDSE